MEKIKITNEGNKIEIYVNEEKIYPIKKKSSKKSTKKYKDITLEDLGFVKDKNGKYRYPNPSDSYDEHKIDIIIEKDQNLIIEPGTTIKLPGYYNWEVVPPILCYGRITAVGTEDQPITFIGECEECTSAILLIKSEGSKFEYCKFNNMNSLAIKKDRDAFMNWYWDGRGDVTDYENGFALNLHKCKNIIIKNCEGCPTHNWDSEPIYQYKCENTIIENFKVYKNDDEDEDD